MAYYFFLGTIPLPVTPSALSVKTPSLNKTVTLINDGEINILKSQGLREITFDFLLPQQKYPFANYSISNYTATTMIPVIKSLKEINKPFQFIVTRMNPKGHVQYFTNITCQIEDFQFDEDAEEHGLDVMCKISLKEYKHYGTKSIKLSEINGNEVASVTTPRAVTKTIPKTVTVKKGDTVWNIAKEYLGNGSRYVEIVKLNKLECPYWGTKRLQVGQVLRLPQ